LTTTAPTAQRDRQRAAVVEPQPNPAASPSKRAEPLQTKPAKTYRRKAATETQVASSSKTAGPTRTGASKPTRKRTAVDPPLQPVVGKRRRAAASMSGGMPPASADDDMGDARSDGPPASSLEASLVGDQREGGTPSLPSEHGRTGRSTEVDENYVPPPAEGTHHAPPPAEEADVIPVTLEAFENHFGTVPLPPVWGACGACLRRILRRACDSYRYSPVLDDTLCISSTRGGAGVCDNCSANRKRCLDVSVLLSIL